MKNKGEKGIKLPLIKLEQNLNYSINKTETLLSKSNSSKYFNNKNDSSKKTSRNFFPRNNQINSTVNKRFISSFRIGKLIEEIPLNKKLEKINEEKKKKKYYYKIHSFGNDSSTIKKCFEHRINW